MPVALAVVCVVPRRGNRTAGRVSAAGLPDGSLRVGEARAHRGALCSGTNRRSGNPRPDTSGIIRCGTRRGTCVVCSAAVAPKVGGGLEIFACRVAV